MCPNFPSSINCFPSRLKSSRLFIAIKYQKSQFVVLLLFGCISLPSVSASGTKLYPSDYHACLPCMTTAALRCSSLHYRNSPPSRHSILSAAFLLTKSNHLIPALLPILLPCFPPSPSHCCTCTGLLDTFCFSSFCLCSDLNLVNHLLFTSLFPHPICCFLLTRVFF